MKAARLTSIAITLALIGLAAGVFAIAAAAGLGGPQYETGREIVVDARQFWYEPAVIRVGQGERVRITLRGMDVTHGLYLDDYGLEVRSTPGRPAQLEFVADKVGQFRFRCTQTCGPLHPFMVGKLVVEPNLPFHASLVLAALTSLAFLGYLWRRQEPSLVPISGGAVGSEDPTLRVDAWTDATHYAPADCATSRHPTGCVMDRKETGQIRPPAARGMPRGDSNGAIRLNLLRVPLIGRFLRWRGFQFAIILPFLFFLMLVLAAGLRGSPVGSHNLGIVFVWIVWWPLLIILLIPLGGRLWCAVCPVPGPGEWLQRLSFIRKREGRLLSLGKRWPAKLRSMWLQNGAFLFIALFSAVVLTTPAATVAVLASFFVAALLLSLIFAGRTFCRYVCPLGGFIGLCSLVAPLALRAKDKGICRAHTGKECLKGSAAGYGCPWFEYPGTMDRNAYCGLCMECLKTCPKDNIAVGWQPVGHDLATHPGQRDEAYRTFIALGSAALYAAVMLGPWGWLKSLAGNPLAPGFAVYAAFLLGISLVAVPGLFLATAWLARLTSGARNISAIRLWLDLSYGLVPLALMAWIAFSLSLVLVSGYYAIPVLSDPLGHGWNLFGTATFEGGPVLIGLLPYLQLGALLVGLLWSIGTSYRLACRVFARREEALRGLLPTTAFLLGTTATFLWLFLG